MINENQILTGHIFYNKSIPYKVIFICRNAIDCEQCMVVYKNLEDTYDFPKGTMFVVPKTYFLRKFYK